MAYDHQTLGGAIRRLRKQRGLSQEVLSGRAGMARSHLAMVESGRKAPSLNTVWNIAQALDISVSSLLRMAEEQLQTPP